MLAVSQENELNLHADIGRLYLAGGSSSLAGEEQGEGGIMPGAGGYNKKTRDNFWRRQKLRVGAPVYVSVSTNKILPGDSVSMNKAKLFLMKYSFITNIHYINNSCKHLLYLFS